MALGTVIGTPFTVRRRWLDRKLAPARIPNDNNAIERAIRGPVEGARASRTFFHLPPGESCLLDCAPDPLHPQLETGRRDAMVLHGRDESQGELLEHPRGTVGFRAVVCCGLPADRPAVGGEAVLDHPSPRKRASVTRSSVATGSLALPRAIGKSSLGRLACLAEIQAIACEIEGIVSKDRTGNLAMPSSIARFPSFHLWCTRLVDDHPWTARPTWPDRIVLLSGVRRCAVSRCKHRRPACTVSQIGLRCLQRRTARWCGPVVISHPTDPRSIASRPARRRRSPRHRYKAHGVDCAARGAIDSGRLCTTSQTGAHSLAVCRSKHSMSPVTV
jgi:hypothetical protein